ncbi:hypothetical protein SMMN14_08305 [Sphaerulina musiva]
MAELAHGGVAHVVVIVVFIVVVVDDDDDDDDAGAAADNDDDDVDMVVCGRSIRASVVAAHALSLSAPIVAGSQRLGSACCSVSLSSPLTGRFTPVVVVSGSGSVIAPSQHPLRSTDFSSFHVVRGAIHAALVCRAPSKSRARMLAMPAAMSLTHRRDDADRASVAHKKA